MVFHLLDIQAGVKLVRGIVKDVQPEKLVLSDGSEVPYGLLVWSTGVGPSGFVKSLDLPKSIDGRYMSHIDLVCFSFTCVIVGLHNGKIFEFFTIEIILFLRWSALNGLSFWIIVA
jgi:hypothetical protein